MADRLAKLIRVVRRPAVDADGKCVGGFTVHMEIDGEEFPYFTVDGYQTTVRREETPGVTLTIAAERVEIDNHLSAPDEVGA